MPAHDFIEATMTSMQEDTDLDWRPRVPQWPAVGDVDGDRGAGRAGRPGRRREQALATAQAEIDGIMQQ